jgi:NADH dehydrogenase [ubiquinone] 1 alpha subcomplex assembly factor 3
MRPGVTILNKEEGTGIFVDAYSTLGFVLNNGLRILGPCAVFPRSVLHWNVRIFDIGGLGGILFVWIIT